MRSVRGGGWQDDAVWAGRATGAAQEVPEVTRAKRELHHDMRQPLAAISALVSAAEAQPEVPEVVRNCLERIGEEARQLLDLCRHVLEEAAAPALVPIGHLAFDVARTCQASTTCRIELDIEPVVAVVDEVGLRRALCNLIDNAVRAAGPSGRVRLGVSRHGEEVLISVGDSGPGFGASVPGAASLGLDIVRRLADDHRGRLDIGTSDLGGALVSITIPAPPPVIDLSPSALAATAASDRQSRKDGMWLSPF
jgi:signal transduction histidine kinase